MATSVRPWLAVSYNLAADPTPPVYDLIVTVRATKTAASAGAYTRSHSAQLELFCPPYKPT